MRKLGQLPVPLRMALSVAGGEMMRREAVNSISELEEQADALNNRARHVELANNAAATNAFRHTQAQVVLRPGGKHPAFGYEVPVGNDQGMIRTAATEMGEGMARDEMEFRKKANLRKAALSMKNKLGIGAGIGMAALGGAGIAADKGIRTTNKYVMNQPYANQGVKIGQVLVQLDACMDKEAIGIMKSLGTAAKGAWLKGKKAFGKSRQAGGSVMGATRDATQSGGSQFGKTYGGSRAKVRGPTGVQTDLPATHAMKPAPKQSVPATTGAAPSKGTGSTASTGAPAAATATPAAGTDGGGMGEGVARWGKKWVVNPAKFTAKNPWTLAAGGGAAAMAYGGYKATKAGVDTLQQHNPQYTYNRGGYQLPTSVGQHGYTKAPGLRY